MNPFEAYLPLIEAEMQRALPPLDTPPTLLYGMLHYHLGWVDAAFAPATSDSGKRLRPVLLLLCCEAQGGDIAQALPAAAAVELLHNFTLIHDDIEDRDEQRRGRPTLWTQWGVPQAINAGDALFTLSYRAMLRLAEREVPPTRALAALDAYTTAVLRITEGQCQDIGFETQEKTSEEAYLAMVTGKTAALIGLVCELGALLGGAPAAQTRALRSFGEALGIAFQMLDDYLGLWGDPQVTGKPVGSDLRKQKKTLPILHGLRQDPELQAQLSVGLTSEEEVSAALRRLEKAGSRDYTRAQAAAYHDRARAALAAAPHATHPRSHEAHAAIEALLERLLQRNK